MWYLDCDERDAGIIVKDLVGLCEEISTSR